MTMLLHAETSGAPVVAATVPSLLRPMAKFSPAATHTMSLHAETSGAPLVPITVPSLSRATAKSPPMAAMYTLLQPETASLPVISPANRALPSALTPMVALLLAATNTTLVQLLVLRWPYWSCPPETIVPLVLRPTLCMLPAAIMPVPPSGSRVSAAPGVTTSWPGFVLSCGLGVVSPTFTGRLLSPLSPPHPAKSAIAIISVSSAAMIFFMRYSSIRPAYAESHAYHIISRPVPQTNRI